MLCAGAMQGVADAEHVDFAVAQQVRHSFVDVRRPVMIAISGMWKDPSDKLIASQVGFDHYLEKPCAPGELLRLLTTIS